MAEIYDVIVEPADDRASTLFAQSIDRMGYARGTLSSREKHVLATTAVLAVGFAAAAGILIQSGTNGFASDVLPGP